MTIATEKLKDSSERYELVTLSPRRILNSFMTLIDPTNKTYSLELGFPVSVESVVLHVNSPTTFTRTTSNPPTSDFTYYVDEDTGSMVIRASSGTSALGSEANGVQYVLTHRIYLSTKPVIAVADPDEVGSPTVSWDPRISDPTRVGQTFENNAFGKFTFGTTSVRIKDDGTFAKRYLGTKDTFCRAAMKIWHCIGSEENRALVFRGLCNGVDFSRDSVSVSAFDDFYSLEAEATFGDDDDELRQTGGRGDDEGKPIRLLMTSRSYQKTAILTAGGDFQDYYQNAGEPAYVTSYSSNKTTSSNRQWTICRTVGGLRTQVFGTIARSTGTTYILVFFDSYENLYIGDSVHWGASAYGTIVWVGEFTNTGDGLLYNVAIYNRSAGTPPTTGQMVAKKCLALSISGIDVATGDPDRVVRPVQTRDYTVSETATAGGNTLVKITFVNNFEANWAGGWVLDPDAHDVQFSAGSASDSTPGALLSFMLQAAGMSVNATTFSDLDTAVAAGLPTVASEFASDECNFTIPYRSETEYGTYHSYVSAILESFMAYLRLNTSIEAEAYLLNAPSSTDDRSDDIAADVRGSIDYQDIASKLTFKNEHCPDGALPTTLTNFTARFASNFHQVDRKDVKTTVAAHKFLTASGGGYQLNPARSAAIVAYFSNRRLNYKFKTAALDVETQLGDDVSLTASAIAGSSTSVQATVVAVDKTTDECELTATDLLGL